MDNKEKKQLAIISVLLFILAAVWYLVLFGFPFEPDGPDPVAMEVEEVVEEGEDIPDEGFIIERVQSAEKHLSSHDYAPDTVDVEDARDVFYHLVVEERPDEPAEVEEEDEALERFHLTSISWSETNRLAVINRQLLRVGDRVAEDAEVIDIKPQGVLLRLRRNEEDRVLKLQLPE